MKKTLLLLTYIILSTAIFAEDQKAISLTKAQEVAKAKEDAINKRIQAVMNTSNSNDGKIYIKTLGNDCDKYITIIAQKDQEIARLQAKIKEQTSVITSIKSKQQKQRSSSLNVGDMIEIHDKPKH